MHGITFTTNPRIAQTNLMTNIRFAGASNPKIGKVHFAECCLEYVQFVEYQIIQMRNVAQNTNYKNSSIRKIQVINLHVSV